MPPSTALLGDEDDGDDADDDDGDGGAPPPLSAHVANAVLPGDPCAWHLDMDPWALPPHSSFAEHVGGAYINRDPRRPRFVSALLYLNPAWPEDGHAETLFADPLTGSGVFVQPRQGRVVLMDQDAPHRIGSPARSAAPAPRYSLVWKLVFWPRLLLSGGGGGGGGGSGPSSDALLPPPLCRPEWGAPQRIGSAAGLPVQVDVSSC
jgi:probable phosphoglycerate mutase